MFGNKVVAWACIGQFVINLCTMGATTYIARYFQGVLFLDATTAGFYLLPFADQIRDLYASGIGTGYLICGILVLLVLILVFYLKDDKKKVSE